jgi:SpoVK/Ycf46/Vps4 family AAA+-type ATPase
LQGKTIKEIKGTLIKVFRGGQREVVSMEAAIIKKLNLIEKERKAFGEKAVKIPEVKWADIGGLAAAKEDIMQTIMLPIEKPHLFKSNALKITLYRWSCLKIRTSFLWPTRYRQDTTC